MGEAELKKEIESLKKKIDEQERCIKALDGMCDYRYKEVLKLEAEIER